MQVEQLPARQSRCYSRSNSPANRTRNHRRRAHKGPGPNSRRRTEIELLNCAALNGSRPLNEAAKRLSDRGTIPASIDHGSGVGSTWQSRGDPGSFWPSEADVIPARIHPPKGLAISREGLVPWPPIEQTFSRALPRILRPRQRTLRTTISMVPAGTTIFAAH